MKSASYPFDWLVSRLPVIEHCMATGFTEFLNPANYSKKRCATYHYPKRAPPEWICDERIVYNEFYERTATVDIPAPLNTSTDAYAHKLMMNHHDITTDADRLYYNRCVERWNAMMSSPLKKLAVYIHPAISHEFYVESDLKSELRRFHRTLDGSVDGIYIIPVRTDYDVPTNHCAKYDLEEQADDADTPGCRICVLWTNRGFVDAGEIFMGNCHVETYVVKEYVQKTYQLGHIPIIGV
jgi:hypothetical protein